MDQDIIYPLWVRLLEISAEGLKADVYKVELKFLKNYNGNEKHETCWNMHWMRCQSIARLPPAFHQASFTNCQYPFIPLCAERHGESKECYSHDPARFQTQTPQPKSSSLSIRPPWIPLLRHTSHYFLQCPYWLWVYGSRIFELKLKMWIWKRSLQQSWVQIPYRPEFILAFFSLLLNR